MHINNSPPGSAGHVAWRGDHRSLLRLSRSLFVCFLRPVRGVGVPCVCVCVCLGGEQGASWTSISDGSTVRKVDFPFYGASFCFSSSLCLFSFHLPFICFDCGFQMRY